ncbi:MAG: hypothetical protein PHE51_05825 [Eubacteriales bacterium]|nr:hypothetical protein [Eubacteriales bacterium]
MKDINEIMGQFSQAELQEGIERAKKLMNVPEAEELRKKLATMDKKELLQKLSSIDSTSKSGKGINSVSNKEILDKLNQFCDRK